MTMEQLNTAKQVLLEDMKDYLDLFTEDNCNVPYVIADVERFEFESDIAR